jgi:predicted DNA binding CopG/RHH family protein
MQIAVPDVLLSALLTQLQDAAQARGIPFEKLLTEVLGQLAEKAPASGPKLARPA